MFEGVNIHSSVAVYMQIENEVMFAIAAGKLKPGDQVPSVRELSERGEWNESTVGKAYRDSEVVGVVKTLGGRSVVETAGGRGGG